MRKSILIFLIIFICKASPTHGEEPIEVVQNTVNLGISILKDPQYAEVTQKVVQRQRLCETARRAFDFEEFSRLTLASNWTKFSHRQRKHFIQVFAKFLCEYYLTLLQERYSDEKVIYVGQRLLTNSMALVEVKVLWRDMGVPVEIRLLMRKDSWKVYDIVVLGISAVLFYRAQFEVILLKDSPGQVIERLENKIKQQEKERLKGTGMSGPNIR